MRKVERMEGGGRKVEVGKTGDEKVECGSLKKKERKWKIAKRRCIGVAAARRFTTQQWMLIRK
jgi:hypothetical protein